MPTEPQLPAPELPSDVYSTISSNLTGKLLQRFALVNKDSYRQSLFEPKYLKVLKILLAQEPEKKWQHWFKGCEAFRSPVGHVIRHKIIGDKHDKIYYADQLRNELKQKRILETDLLIFALSNDIYLQLLAYKTITLQDLAAIPAEKQQFFQSSVIAYIMLEECLTLDALKQLPDYHLALFNNKACELLLKKFPRLVVLVAQMPYAQAKRLKQLYLYSLMQIEEVDRVGANLPIMHKELQAILQWPVQLNEFLDELLNWCNGVQMPILLFFARTDGSETFVRTSRSEILLNPPLAQMIFEIYQVNPTMFHCDKKILKHILQGLKYGYFSEQEIIKTTIRQCHYIVAFMNQEIPLQEIKSLLAYDNQELNLLGIAINKNPQYWEQLRKQEMFTIDIINQQLKSFAAAQPKHKPY